MLQERSTSNRDGLWARALNLMLGGWLFISAFAWDHALAERVNAAYVGFLIFAAALAAVSMPRARHLTGWLALWLLVSSLVLPTVHAGTRWNNVLVAVSAFALSLVKPRELRFAHRGGARGREATGEAA